MGLLDDIEAAERTEREPLRSRLLRRIGGGLAIAAVVMCLLGILGERWWSLEFDSGPINIALGDIQYCDPRGECEDISDHEFLSYAATRSDNRADIQAWMATRKAARVGLGLAMAAALVLAVWTLGPRRRDRTRLVAAIGASVAVLAIVLVWRFAGTTPFDLLSRSLHLYVALAGLVDLLVGAALAGIPSPHAALPTAKVVTRS